MEVEEAINDKRFERLLLGKRGTEEKGERRKAAPAVDVLVVVVAVLVVVVV